MLTHWLFEFSRRDRDSNSGTKILGHSLAGCCITTLPPLPNRTLRQSAAANLRKLVAQTKENSYLTGSIFDLNYPPIHPTMKKVLILSVFAFFALAVSAQSTTADKGGQTTVEQSNGGKGSKASTAASRNSSLGALQPAPATQPSEEGKQKEASCQGEGKSEKGACCSSKGKSEGGACCSEKGKGHGGERGEKSGCAGHSGKEGARAEAEGKSGGCCAGKSAGASCSGNGHSEGDRKEKH